MNILFVSSFDENKNFTGINKKIYNQYLALKKNKGFKVYLSTVSSEKNTKKIGIYNEDTNFILKNKFSFFLKRWFFIDEIIKKKQIDILYIRYEHFSSPEFIKFLKRNKEKKILLEIPTYPYDDEYKNVSKLKKIKIEIDKIYRKKMYKYVDKIVTFSEDDKIWGIPCINISNGISLEENFEENKNKRDNLLVFTSVSSCELWHGIDRFIFSLEKYGQLINKKKIIFNIVGEGLEIDRLKEIVFRNNYLSQIVIFNGFKTGKELTEIYDKTDIAVGSLARHRSGLYSMRALKNREYCAKGLPMIFSEDDPDFRDVPFVYHIQPNEKLIEINLLIEWYEKLNLESSDIREYSKQFSWDIQMKKVIEEIEKIELQ